MRCDRIVALLGSALYLLALEQQPALAETNAREATFTIDLAAPGMSLERTAQETERLDEALAPMAAIEWRISIVRHELGRTIVKLRAGRADDAAVAELHARVGQSPVGGMAPVIAQIGYDAQAVVYLGLHTYAHTAVEVTHFAERYAVEPLRGVAGVAGVQLYGASHEALRIRFDRARLDAYGIGAEEIAVALRRHKVEMRAERDDTAGPVSLVLSLGEFRTPQQLHRVVIKERSGVPIELRDVARVELGALGDGTMARINGAVAVLVEVTKRPATSMPDATRAVRDALPAILAQLPGGMRHAVLYSCTRCATPPRR